MSHGSGTKISPLAPRSPFYHGPFGRLFDNLAPWAPAGKHGEKEIEDHFMDMAQTLMSEAPGKKPGDLAKDDEAREELERRFNSGIPAAYTYFGQFIDHDITFDPVSSLMRANDPNGLLNHRTPRLDLDCVYGRGPDDNPYLYDANDKAKFLIGKIPGTELRDLPRNVQGRALIGDMRNDENSIVSQVQLAFLLAHNTLVDRARASGVDNPFAAARKTLRWLYQYIVRHDFLARVTRKDILDAALNLRTACDGRSYWECGLKDIYNWKHRPFMPVEFSVAAYRFGHSMVRNAYQTNFPHRGFSEFAPIFDNSGSADPDDLRGFRPLKKENYLQWDWFLPMTSARPPFPQPARKIDTKLSNALAALHEDAAGSPLNVLAFRNLMRGFRFDLPSGTAVAEHLCIDPVKVAPEHDSLWFYILKESEEIESGERLGRIGSYIVCATFAGLLKGDPSSYINVKPCWTPDDDPLLEENDKQDEKDWTLASIIRLSGLPVGDADIDNQT